MPESPRYLIASGRKDEALEILRGIAKKNNKELPSKDIITSQLPVSKLLVMNVLLGHLMMHLIIGAERKFKCYCAFFLSLFIIVF